VTRKAPAVWDGQPREHAGMLWKPSPGTSVTFEQFVEARLLVLEIYSDMHWNAWRHDERAQELHDAREVIVQWERAEPGFQMMTDDEVTAWLAELKEEQEADCRERERQRLARIPLYNEQRERARLALLELEAPWSRLDLDRSGLEQLRQVV